MSSELSQANEDSRIDGSNSKFLPTARFETTLLLAAVLLIAVGLIHVPVFLLAGQAWEGPLSFRKPILFGISTGLTVASLAWVMPRLRRRAGDSILNAVVSVAMVIEVGLITAQTWRGEASHFNQATALDRTIDSVMLAMITVATIAIVYVAVRSLAYLNAADDVRTGINAGFAFLILSCVIGYVISHHGHQQVIEGKNPSVYGQSGVTKFPHGVAIHAIQIFPLISWVLMGLGVPLAWRKKVVGLAIAFMAAMLVFSIVQTLQGRARFDLSQLYSLPTYF